MAGKRIFIRIGIFVVFLAGIFIMKHYQKNNANEKIRKEMKKNIVMLPGYKDDSKYVDRQFNQAHPKAFTKTWDEGWDNKKYVSSLYDEMIKVAKKDGKKELVAGMEFHLALLSGEKAQQENIIIEKTPDEVFGPEGKGSPSNKASPEVPKKEDPKGTKKATGK